MAVRERDRVAPLEDLAGEPVDPAEPEVERPSPSEAGRAARGRVPGRPAEEREQVQEVEEGEGSVAEEAVGRVQEEGRLGGQARVLDPEGPHGRPGGDDVGGAQEVPPEVSESAVDVDPREPGGTQGEFRSIVVDGPQPASPERVEEDGALRFGDEDVHVPRGVLKGRDVLDHRDGKPVVGGDLADQPEGSAARLQGPSLRLELRAPSLRDLDALGRESEPDGGQEPVRLREAEGRIDGTGVGARPEGLPAPPRVG